MLFPLGVHVLAFFLSRFPVRACEMQKSLEVVASGLRKKKASV